jgi:hypothetical protein
MTPHARRQAAVVGEREFGVEPCAPGAANHPGDRPRPLPALRQRYGARQLVASGGLPGRTRHATDLDQKRCRAELPSIEGVRLVRAALSVRDEA